VIDGIVDETVWDGAPPFSTFIQQEPNEGEPATERTEGLLQYNRQASTFSSNVRLALLNRSGTGLFLVYNDRRDTSAFTADELLGRSVIAKYTRLFDF
jgi:hypothetical protein